MPLLVTYQGRPVKRHYRTEDGQVHVILYNHEVGGASEQFVVTQADWKLYSNQQFYDKGRMPDVRTLAAKFSKD